VCQRTLNVMHKLLTILTLTCLVSFNCGSASGDGAKSDFGANTRVRTIGAEAFWVETGADSRRFFGGSEIYASSTVTNGNDCRFRARVDLPSGARLSGLEIVGYDDFPIMGPIDLGVSIALHQVCRAGLNLPVNTKLVEVRSIDAPGYFRTFQDLDHTIDNKNCHYYVRLPFNTPGASCAGDTNRLSHVRLHWQRQISPSPAISTFNDVQTSHPFYSSIEAMGASGITGGCGGGNYCPDDPLTRGQMAAFLTRALGL